MRDKLTRHVMSLTVLSQAECDANFLTLHTGGNSVALRQGIPAMLQESKELLHYLGHSISSAKMLLRIFATVCQHFSCVTRPLTWSDSSTGWILEASGAPDLMPRLPLYATAWALAPFKLRLVGHLGTIPVQQCQILLGIKIPLTPTALVPDLWQDRYLVVQAFGFNLVTPLGTMRTLHSQLWFWGTPDGFCCI